MGMYPRGKRRGWLPEAERTVVRSRQHWMELVRDLVLASPAVVVVLLLDSAVERHAGPALLSLPFASAVVLATGWALVRRLSTSLTVTGEHLILESGVLVRVKRAIPLSKIHRVVIRRTLPGWLLGYGTIEFHVLASERPERFRRAPSAVLDQEIFMPRLPPVPLYRVRV